MGAAAEWCVPRCPAFLYFAGDRDRECPCQMAHRLLAEQSPNPTEEAGL